MNKKYLKSIEIHFVNGTPFDTVKNPKDAGNRDKCYFIETQNNRINIYPFTSILKIIEYWENKKGESDE